MNLTADQMQADIAFLLLRAGCAGSVSFTSDRWTGTSSNSIVGIAYGSGKDQDMPWDRSDYAACVRTVRRLPKHRRTEAVLAALAKAREAYLERHPEDRCSLERRRIHEEWDRERRERDERRMKRRRKRNRL